MPNIADLVNDRIDQIDRICALRVGGWALGLLMAAQAAAQGTSEPMLAPINLHYVQRPPYMMASTNGLTGLTGGAAAQAFKAAAIPFELKETPFVRQLRMLETNSGQDCMIGMFKTPQRESFARFTKPIYRDKMQIILTAQSNAHRFEGLRTLEDVFKDKSLLLLAKLGYSYGDAMDTRVAELAPTTRKTTDENLLMVKAIKLHMADYMIMAPEEANQAILAAGFKDSEFAQIKVENMPPTEFRHIMCSKSVPDEVIKRLNAAIRY